MTKIRYIKDSNDQDFFPVTHERAVRDSNGVTLDEKLAEMSDPNAVKYTEQALTDAQKAMARKNIASVSAVDLSGEIEDINLGPNVQYVVQSLNETQKTQARANIGAANAEDIPNITISSSEPTSQDGNDGDIWIVV